MFVFGWLRSGRMLTKAVKLAEKAQRLHERIATREEGTKEAIAALGSELKALATVREKVSKWL